MSAEALARTDHELRMVEALVDCANALALRFGAAAKAEPEARRALELCEAFHRSFLAVRMGIRLSLMLRAPPKTAATVSVAQEAREAVERDPPEDERPERGEAAERERDRDYEPVSLPRFLSTLGVVARDAERVPEAAGSGILPVLRRHLAEAGAATSPPVSKGAASVAVLARRPTAPARAALLSSAIRPHVPASRRHSLPPLAGESGAKPEGRVADGGSLRGEESLPPSTLVLRTAGHFPRKRGKTLPRPPPRGPS